MTSSLNAVGVLLIGQLGATEVAAVGLANQIFYLLNLMLFGIISGSAIFTAQYWGSQDLPNIRKVVALCLGLSAAAGLFFTVVALGFPRFALGLYTNDQAVIELGCQYLEIIGVSYLATAVSFTFNLQLRATGNVRVPMLVSVGALSLGALLNYLLIFGKFGLPVMGVRGAALGTCIARLIECAAILAVTYIKRLPTATYLADMRKLTGAYVRNFLTTMLPVAANETIWAIGTSIYNLIYAHISTESIAAVNITSTIEALVFVALTGISSASSIIIGNRIGAGEEQKAYLYARWSLLLTIFLAFFIGAGLIFLSGPIVSLYKISETAAAYTRGILIVLGSIMWIRASNNMFIVGILRSGGDTRFSLVLDVGTVWLVGIPMALLGAFVFKLPVYWVVAMVAGDDVAKAVGGLFRYRSRKWINNLARSGEHQFSE